MEKTVINVNGLTCNHCVQAVTKAVSALPGVGNVVVELSNGTASVEHDPSITDVAKIKAAIEDQGYNVLD